LPIVMGGVDPAGMTGSGEKDEGVR